MIAFLKLLSKLLLVIESWLRKIKFKISYQTETKRLRWPMTQKSIRLINVFEFSMIRLIPSKLQSAFKNVKTSNASGHQTVVCSFASEGIHIMCYRISVSLSLSSNIPSTHTLTHIQVSIITHQSRACLEPGRTKMALRRSNQSKIILQSPLAGALHKSANSSPRAV